MPASASTVAAYLSVRAEAGSSVNTIRQAQAAIVKAHEAGGHPSPVNNAVRHVVKGIARKGAAPSQVAGVQWAAADSVASLAANGGGSLAGLRDAALVAVASDAMLRISEVLALDVQDVEAEAACTVTIRKSKTDQEGMGHVLPLRKSTVRRIRHWLAEAGIESGANFRRVRRGGHVVDARITTQAARIVIKGSRAGCRAGW